MLGGGGADLQGPLLPPSSGILLPPPPFLSLPDEVCHVLFEP